jgi:ABC-2 type transport system permease protein
MLVFGGVLGSIAKGIDSLLNGSKQASDIIARYGGASGLTDAYLVTCMTFLAMAAAVYGVQAVLRLRAEETSGRAEPVLAGRVGRAAWATSHVVYPAFGGVLLMLAGGLGTGIGAGAVLGDFWSWTGKMLLSGLAQVPAVWIFAAAGLALFGLVPKYTSAAWGVLGVLLLIAYLGPAIDLGPWFLDLTPFTHIPHIPGGTFRWAPILWLTGVSAVLTAAGYRGLQRRDVTP